MAEYKIRPLLKRDQLRLAAIFKALIDRFDEKAIGSIMRSESSGPSDGPAAAPISDREHGIKVAFVFFEVIKKAMTHMSDEMSAFFADLIGVTADEYQDLPIDIDVQILEQLKEAPEVTNFFTGLSRLSSGTPWLKKITAKLNAAFGSIRDTLQSSSES